VVVSQTLKDVATASIQSPQQLLRKVQKGMNRLYGFQHDDGGWGWWTDDQSDPFMTAYVVDGLLQARDAGYKVEEYRLEQGRNWLRKTLETSWEDKSQSIDLETRAYLNYACVASGSAGQSVSPLLFERRQELKPFGVSLLGLTLLLEKDESRARQAADELEASARVNENEAYWVSVRKPRLDFSEQNDLEATSLALKVLCRVKPQSPLLPKVARWLMANRRLGSAWDSTKQTAFAILGLDEYLKITGELNSSFQLQVLLNGEPVHSGTFAGPAGLRAPFVLERKGASVPGNLQVKLVKKGKGPLYVSSALAYFAGGESVPAQSSPELSVRREYFRLLISREGDRPAWKMQPLTGEIRAGDLIVSRLTLQGARAQYLMLEDPIPAGCEQVESAGGLNLGHATRNWCDWYSQREFRDDRTVFFLSDFYGKAALQYVLRVIVPGGFHVGPPRAELMYRPAVHAHDASQTIQFSDRP
jgi:uncharacterized protein YfaS (alpha-2-macroglobulin family)